MRKVRPGSARAGGLVVATSAVLTLVAGCNLPTASGASNQDGAPTSSTGDAAAAATELTHLRVAPEDTGAHYNRDDWKHWIGQPAFGKGCDTREMVLIQQGHHAGGGSVVHDPSTCRVASGHGNSWVSSYDNVTVTDPGTLDVDHAVPLEEVARSGSRGWSAAQRQAYANDPDVLVAVTAHSNRSKGSGDPATWVPEQNKCPYLIRWVTIKTKYTLTVDQAEHEAIASGLRRCGAPNAS